jgi:D-alanyl-D-alanine-carboxypeptidase/D-alanyl-D-alanine-endopeptidase
MTAMRIGLAALVLSVLVASATLVAQPPADEEIRKILVQRVDDYHQAVGLVVGVIDAKGRRFVSYGSLAKGDTRPLSGDTVFEIGSITKVFTSLILADMVRKGEVALTDPVAKYLPETVKVPTRGERQITLQDLATHTSGLPPMPSNFKPANGANPYADYTIEQMYAFLSSHTLTREIGAQYEYSNFGVGLLGNALARRAGKDYETLVRERVTGPLKMNDTAITLSDAMKTRLAQGHSGNLQPVPLWDLPTFAGAGALRSTASDMLTFISVPLGFSESPLAPAFAAMYQPRKPTGMGPVEIALGWHVRKTEAGEIIWHNGGTGGYRSFVGFDLKARTGLVVLANTSTGAGVDDIGFHLLAPEVPLMPAPKVHTEKTVDPKIFANLVGKYALKPDFILTITSENDKLFAQATGQRSFELFAESEREFFAKVADISIVFDVDAQGRATSLTLLQGAARVPAKRIE